MTNFREVAESFQKSKVGHRVIIDLENALDLYKIEQSNGGLLHIIDCLRNLGTSFIYNISKGEILSDIYQEMEDNLIRFISAISRYLIGKDDAALNDAALETAYFMHDLAVRAEIEFDFDEATIQELKRMINITFIMINIHDDILGRVQSLLENIYSNLEGLNTRRK